MAGNMQASFDGVASRYKDEVEQGMVLRGSGHDYFVNYKMHYLRPLIESSANRKVLDYGCGIGLLSEAIIDSCEGATVHGFDVSAESIAHVPDHLRCEPNRFTSDLASLDQDYDIALLVAVLHHIPIEERETAVTNIFERLRGGGALVIIEHNMLNPLTRKSVGSCVFDEDAIMLEKAESVDLLSGKFADVTSRYITFWPKQLSFMKWSDRLIGWVPLGAQYMVVGRKPC